MNLIPRKRSGDGIQGLQSQVNRLFNEFFGEFGVQTPAAFGDWAPMIDVAETDNEVLLTFELPGVDPKDVDLSIAGEMLTIKGNKKSELEEKGKSWHRVERTFGTFQRSFTLPCPVDSDKVKAEYKNGILTVTIPKREEARTKPIKVAIK